MVEAWKYRLKNIRHLKLIALIILVVILAIIPLVTDAPYYMHLLIMTGMNAILAMTFILMLRTGLISLGIAAFWGVGAYASAVLVMKVGLPFWVAMPAAIVITGVVALGVGYFVVRTPGFGFLILTAVIGMAAVLVFGNIRFLGGFEGIDAIPPPTPITLPLLPPIEFISKTPYYYLMLFLLVLVVLVFAALYATWTGRAWTAIGRNVQLAKSIGVNVFRYRLLAFVIASATAGLAGSFYAHYMGSIIPEAFGIFKTIYVHVYAILGGTGFAFLGPLVGTLIMTFVPEFIRTAEEIEPILTGLLLILLMLFLPGGVLSLPRLRERMLQPAANIFRMGRAAKPSFSSDRKASEGNDAASEKSK